MTSRTLKSILMATVAATGMGVVSSALAQETGSTEKVTVTGTRIKQPNNTSTTATNTINLQQIELSGEGNIVDVLRDLPIVGVPGISSVNSNFATTGNGINSLNLRNLGANRALVLVNGRRFIAGVALTQIVDFNALPTEMIERVDVVAGGSSAVYGSDAIAGVVNVILKKNFEGVAANIQYGTTETYAEKEDVQATVTVGANFANDAGNATMSVGYNRFGPAYARSRSTDTIDCLGGAFFGSSAFIDVCPFKSSFAEGGVFRLSNIAAGAETGRVRDPLTGNIRTLGGTEGFNRQAKRLHFVPTDKIHFAGNMNYDYAPGHNAYVELNYSTTVSDADFEPIPLSSADVYGLPGNDSAQQAAILGQRLGIAPDNPYVPRDLLDLMCQRWAVHPNLAACQADTRANLVAGLMANPGAVIGFRRRMSEFGNRGGEFESTTGRFVVGSEGKIGNWDYDASYTWGKTVQAQFSQNGGINSSNWRNALDVEDLNLDADNNPNTNPQDVRCRDAAARLEGCVPVDLFLRLDQVGNWTPAQIAWLRTPITREQSQEHHIVTMQATGGLFDLWAGEVEGAVGAEYRLERGKDLPDALTQSGQNGGNLTPATKGSFDVYEVFGEVKVPLLRDEFLIKELNVHGAARYSDYSTSTGGTFAASGDFDWTVTDGLRFRGQMARAVRAPNIGELFTGPSETFATITDPCNNIRLAPGDEVAAPYTNLNAAGTTNQTIIANCLTNAGFTARAISPGGFVLTQVEIQGTGGFTSGNSTLTQETSDSLQLGFVITPAFWGDWLGNLTVSGDYFNVDIRDAISTVGRQNTLTFCYGAAGFALPFCSQTPSPGGIEGFVRDANGVLIEVNTSLNNRDQIETSGYELQANYNFGLNSLIGEEEEDFGRLQLSVTWQHNNTYAVTSLAGTALATTADFVDSIGVFENEAVLGAVYTVGDLRISYSGQWMDEVSGVDNPGDLAGIGDQIDEQWFHDVSMSYDLTENLRLYGGVRNLGDNYVFIGQSQFGAQPTGWTTAPDTYDGLGRRWFMGLRVNM